MMGVVVFLAIIAIIVSYSFTITPSSYFGGKYNSFMLYFLIVYKFIELPTLYYLLFHRHVMHIRKNPDYHERLDKIRKHTKLLLFLIPQGNTVFGIISYKLSGNTCIFFFSLPLPSLLLFQLNLISCITIHIKIYSTNPNCQLKNRFESCLVHKKNS